MAKTTKKSAPAKTKKTVVSKKAPVKKVSAKKAPVKKVSAKKTVVKKTAVKKSTPHKKVDNLNLLKAAITNIEKSSIQVFDAAKQQAQQYAKQTMVMVNRYNDELKKLMTQDKNLEQKLRAAESKLKTKATAANKIAIKKVQKVWNDVKKQQQQVVNQLKHSESVQSMAKNLESKLNFLAKELREIAKSWRPEEPKAAKPKATKTAKPAVKKAAPKTAAKPAASSKPAQTETPANSQIATPAKSPFSTPITPQNIAQKPLTGSTNGQGSQESSTKSFGGFRDDF